MTDKFLDSFKGKYKNSIYDKFVKASGDFKLIENGDKIAVCISGGKDSMMLAKCMQLYKQQSGIKFDIVNLIMDPGYRPENRQRIISNAKDMGIDITIFDSEIFNVVEVAGGSPCYLCARMRRGTLYSKAKAAGCNKIALGHHFDDVTETALMGIIYNGQVQSMRPKLTSKNFDNMQLIRPLYYVKEKDIISWRDNFSLSFLLCACKMTENAEKSDSKRSEIKELIRSLSEKYENAAENIFYAASHINLDNISGAKIGGKNLADLEDFDIINS